MTHPNHDITALVERCDREAASEWRMDMDPGMLSLLAAAFSRHRRRTLAAQQAALAAKDSEIERLREALGKDVTRFTYCAQMIETSFLAGGTLRAERAMKAQHFALEAQAALGDVKP